MVPILTGRIQTRLFLLALVGSLVTLVLIPLLPVPVPLIDTVPPGWAFATHFAVVWVVVWLVANGPMRVPFLRWRFRGGRLV